MKKITLILFSISVFFAPLSALNVEDEYKKALKAYKQKDYQRSYELLSKLYLTRLSDVDLNYQLGRSAYETGHYEIALAAFERVDMLDEGNIRNKLEMARTYFMLKMYEESKNAFEEVLQNQSIPDNVRKNIEIYLSKTSKVLNRSFTYGVVGLDLLYDTNINFSSSNDYYEINGVKLPTGEEKGGGALQFLGSVSNIYDIGDKNGFAIKNRLTTLYKGHLNSDNSDYDIGFIAYNPSLLYKETKFTTELELGLDKLYISGDSYLQSLSISPKIDWNHTPTLKSLVSFKYYSKDYNNNSLDSQMYELSYGLQKILSPRSYVQANLLASKQKKDGGVSVVVDYDEHKLNLNYANQINPTFGYEAIAQLYKRSYKDNTPMFGNTREDNVATITAAFMAKVISNTMIKAKLQYSKADSNQEIYSYDKGVVTIGLVTTF